MEKFSTSITGYKKEEVNKFIDDVIKQVESMINNMKSKDLEIEKLKSELEADDSLFAEKSLRCLEELAKEYF